MTLTSNSSAKTTTATSSADIIPLNPATAPSTRESSRMPFEKFKEFWQRQIVADSKLPASAMKIAIAISWHMSRTRGGEAWPGIATLATLTGMSARNVIRATKRLEAAGHLRVSRSMAGNKRGLNHYWPLLTSKMSVGGDKALSVSSDKAVSHKPLNEPLREPLSYTAPTDVGVIHGDQNNQSKRVAEEEREDGSREENGTRHRSDNLYQSSIRQRCYRLIRQHASTKLGLLTRVFRAGAVPAEVLAAVEECIADPPGDFSYALLSTASLH